MSQLTLILMRHAEANNDGPSDHARALSAHGTTQAKNAGATLAKIADQCDQAIVSTATRTRQTASIVFESLQPGQTHFSDNLYHANNARDYLDEISKHVNARDRVVLVIGHNPVISLLASTLCGEVLGFSPANFVALAMESSEWPVALHSSGCWSIKKSHT